MKKIRQNCVTKIYGLIVIAVITAMAVSCTKDNTNLTPPANEVYIENTAFTPSTITITVNTTIKWTNKDGITHTVTSDASLFDSGAMGSGATFSQQFSIAGTYKYHCSYHSSMKGTIVVN